MINKEKDVYFPKLRLGKQAEKLLLLPMLVFWIVTSWAPEDGGGKLLRNADISYKITHRYNPDNQHQDLRSLQNLKTQSQENIFLTGRK
jgi:hypothetical protein